MLLPNIETLRYEGLPRFPHTPDSVLNVAITNQRLYAARSFSLARFKQLGKQAGCTVNDVVLAVCSDTLRRYLLGRNALPQRSLTAMIPVTARENAANGAPNQNAMFVCNLGTDLTDPVERLLAIHQSAREQRRKMENVKNLLLPDLVVLGGGAMLSALVGLYSHAKLAERLPHIGNLTISNIPGPPMPLFIAGARVLTLYPCSIPFHGSALNMTVQSYSDQLDFGLIACRRAVPDLDVLADALQDSLDALEQAVIQRGNAESPRLPSVSATSAPTTLDGGRAARAHSS